MKKLLCITLALVLAISMLAGCGGGDDDYSADISAFADTDETLSISWLGYPVFAGSSEGLPTELLLEDKFNVEIEPIFAEYNNYNDKKNALMQSGDIPDLIYEMDPMYLFADVRDEFLLEVPYETIKKYAPSLYTQIVEEAPAAWAYSYYESKNYGLPNMNYSHVVNPVSGFRADWLEKLGMQVPNTLDELHDVLYAFVHNDPDGDGKDDTYGYTPSINHYSVYFAEFFGAYGILPFDWQEVDGEVVYGGLRPETEQVLQMLADWYKDGLIYPGFIEGDREQSELFKNGLVGYVTDMKYQDATNPDSTLAGTIALNPDAELAYGKLATGPDGQSGIRGWGLPAHVVAFGANGEESAKKATRILKILETTYTDKELLKEIRLGKEGESYTVNDNSTAVNNFSPTKDYIETTQRRLAGYDFNMSGATFWSPIAPSEELYQETCSKTYLDWKAKFAEPDNILTDVFYKVDIVPSASTYIADIQNAQMALMSAIIKGEKPADQYIEEFTKIWESSSGTQLLSEAHEQYKILEEIYKKIGIEE